MLLTCALVALALRPPGSPLRPSRSSTTRGTARRRLDGAYQHWSQAGHRPPDDIASNYYPARGVYSSATRPSVASQMAEIKAAGVDQIVVSWWGRGSAEDARLPQVIAAAHGGRARRRRAHRAVRGRTVASVVSDIDYLRTLGIRTFYVFRPLDFPSADWAAANARSAGRRRSTRRPGSSDGRDGHFAGIYTYDVLTYGGDTSAGSAPRRTRPPLCLPSVGPGFDARAPRATRAEAAAQRRDVRLDVEARARLGRGPGHDHVVQRVARGDPDRAGRAARPPRRVPVPRLHRRVGPHGRGGGARVPRPHRVLGRAVPKVLAARATTATH